MYLPLSLTTLLIILVAIVLPNSPLAAPLGFVPLPWAYWPVLAAIVLAYCTMVQIVKGRLTRRSESYLSTAA